MPEKQPERIHIASGADLAAHFDSIHQDLAQQETEHTWQKLDRALLKLEAVTKGGGYKFDDFVPQMKAVAGPLARSLLSERTKLSGTAADVLNSVAPRLADRFESLVNYYVPPLLLLCARTNKVALKRAEKCLYLIARHCQLISTLPLLREACKDKFAGLRVVAVATMATTVEYAGRGKLTRKVAEVETVIRLSATDSNVEVRQNSKRLFEVYVATWPDRVESFTAVFTPTIRRYLSLPKTGSYRPTPDVFAAAMEQPASSSATARELPAQTYVPPLRVSKASAVQSHQEAPIVPREDNARSNNFLEQLVAAKSRAKAPSHIQSTGLLKGLNAADVFGPQRSDRPRTGEQKPTRVLSSSASSNAALRSSTSTYPAASSSKVKVNDEWGHVRSATHHESSQTPLAAPILTMQRSLSSSHPPPSGTLASSDDETSPLAVRESRTAPVTPAAGLHSADSGSESENTPETPSVVGPSQPTIQEATPSHSAVPSDGVARRLASMAQEQTARAARQPAEGISTPTQRTLSAGTSKTAGMTAGNAPKAARVAVPPPVQRPTAATQRQVSATRVARTNTVANLGESSKGTAQSAAPIEPKSAVKKQPAAPAAKTKPAPASPRKVRPIKTTGKVVSSTTQSLSAKSSAISTNAAGSAAGKKKTVNPQSAREAMMAKKQAEVAKLRAQAKARSEQAAMSAAASQAQRQAKTKQLREMTTHPGPAAATPGAKQEASDGDEAEVQAGSTQEADVRVEQDNHNQAASPQRSPLSPQRSPRIERQAPKTPRSPRSPRSPRTPFTDITAEVHHDTMAKANSSPPKQSPSMPFKATPSHRSNGFPAGMSFSSPADKLRAQMGAMSFGGAGEDWQPIDAGPLRLSPVKGRIATPVRATKFGVSGGANRRTPGNAGAGCGSDEALEDQENTQPRSIREEDAKVTLISNGRRSQLVCQLSSEEGSSEVGSDNDTLIEA